MPLETIIQENRPSRKEWSGRPGSNRRRPAWEAGILPLNYSRPRATRPILTGSSSPLEEGMLGAGFSRSRFQRSEISYLSWKIGVGSRRAQFSLLADAGT